MYVILDSIQVNETSRNSHSSKESSHKHVNAVILDSIQVNEISRNAKLLEMVIRIMRFLAHM